MDNETIEQKIEGEIKLEAPMTANGEPMRAKEEYETAIVKKWVGDKGKKLFIRAEKAKNYTAGMELINASESSNLEGYIREIDARDKTLKALFKGKTTLWDEIKIAYAKITGSEYKEKEVLIDSMIREGKREVSELDSKLGKVQQTKEQMERYCAEKKETKIALGQSIDDFKAIYSQLGLEMEKYRRDYNRLEEEKNYTLRDRLEIEMDKMLKDEKKISRQIEIASNRYRLLQNTGVVLDALNGQVETAVDRIIVMKSQAEDYITEVSEMKSAILELSGIVKCTMSVKERMEKMKNVLDKGMDLLSQNLQTASKAINGGYSGIYSSETINSITGRKELGAGDSGSSADEILESVQEIRTAPGKYSLKRDN
jgi:chromosome segregation ATPase